MCIHGHMLMENLQVVLICRQIRYNITSSLMLDTTYVFCTYRINKAICRVHNICCGCQFLFIFYDFIKITMRVKNLIEKLKLK